MTTQLTLRATRITPAPPTNGKRPRKRCGIERHTKNGRNQDHCRDCRSILRCEQQEEV